MIKNILLTKSLRELISGSSLILFVRIISILGTYFFIYLISLYFSAEVLGVFSLAQSTIYIFSIFVTLGFDILVVRLASKFNYSNISSFFVAYKKIILLIVTFGSILTIFLNQLAFFISNNIFNEPLSYLPIKYFSYCLIPLAISSINSETFRGFRNVLYYSIFNKASFQLYTSIILFISIFLYSKEISLSYMIPFYSFMIVILFVMIISSYKIYKLFLQNKNVATTNYKTSFTELITVSNPMMVTNIILHILQWSSILFLGIYATVLEVGVFTLVLKISSSVTLILTSINGIAAPKISELYESNKESLKKLIKSITRLTFITSFPILIIVLFVYPYIFEFLGNEYLIGEYALLILLFGQFLNFSSGSVITILNMTNQQSIVRNIIAFGLFVNIVFNIILIPLYGITGAAIATTLGIIMWNLLGVYYVYKKLNIKSYIRI